MKTDFKIRVTKNIGIDSIKTFGEVGTILEVKGYILKDLNNHEWKGITNLLQTISDVNELFLESDNLQTEFELADEKFKLRTSFTKQDLKDGMIVEGLNRNRGLILNDRIYCDYGYEDLENYNDDLIHKSIEKYNIVKVFELNRKCCSLHEMVNCNDGLELIYKNLKEILNYNNK